VFHTIITGVLMTNLSTKFHIPSSSDLLVINISLKAKCASTLLFLYSTKKYLHKRCIFFEDLLPHKILGPCIK